MADASSVYEDLGGGIREDGALSAEAASVVRRNRRAPQLWRSGRDHDIREVQGVLACGWCGEGWREWSGDCPGPAGVAL